jgi:glycosyltransferase involved in cell wall biosynthesis
VGASKICYINTHVYDADPSCPKDLLRAEREIVGKADVLMADSSHNVGRLEGYNPNISVSRAMPGVAVSRFASAFRGDEAEKRNHFLFFGDIGRHLDIDLYNQLAVNHQVTFVGIVDKSIIRDISEKIDVRPPVAPSELPLVLREADILTIFYKPSSYVSGIIPAKFFECLATGKPVFISGLPETNRYKEAIYNIDDGFDKATEYIQNLPELETEKRRNARALAARDADWENRFQQFSKRIFS